MEYVILIGSVTAVPLILLVMTCLLSRCRKKRTKEEIERKMFEKFYKKHMMPSYWGPLRVDFVRRPQPENLNTTQTSVSARSEHTLYDQIGTPSPCNKDVLVSHTPRSPDSSIEKCCVVDEMNSTNTETNSSCDLTQEGDLSGHVTKNWLQTPGRLASYISFRQTSHAILVVPSANDAAVAHAPNVVCSDTRDNSDSDNNSYDYGSEGIQITVPKRLNFDITGSEQMEKIRNDPKISNNDTDVNLSHFYYEKDSKKHLSNTEISIDKTDPTYESIKSLTIPKIRLFTEKGGSHTSDPTYESINSDLCFNFSRGDGLESSRDNLSEGSNFRRSFESVKSGRDFTVFEINCDGENDEDDVFPANLSINSAHTLRHSYAGRVKETPTSVDRRRNSINNCLDDSRIEIKEERYSPFPVAKKLAVKQRAKPLIASPSLCMIKTISGNLRPKSFANSDENPVLNTPRSVPKIKIYDSDCVLNSSILPCDQIDKSTPDILRTTGSVSEVFDSMDDRIPPHKTYQTLRTIYSQARRAARAKKSLKSLPSVTEQTEFELDQHLASNLYVKSTPRPMAEMVSVFSYEQTVSDLC